MATEEDRETGDEIFVLDNNLNEQLDQEQILDLLNDFSFFFTYLIEENFRFFLNVLNGQSAPKQTNSKITNTLAAIFSAIPKIGKVISSGLKEGEIYIFNKIDEKHAATLAHLVYCFSRKKEEIRTILIETAVEIFYCFEHQFLRLNCNGGRPRAMVKLAHNATQRIFTYFFKKEITKISKQNFVEGVIEGDSLLKIPGKSDRTVQFGKDDCRTSDIYKKVGLFFEDNGTYYRTSKTNTKKYGHRRLFSWEKILDKEWEEDEKPSPQPSYYLKKEDLESLYVSVKKYIYSQNPEEEAKLDREYKHVESTEDRSSKHEEIKQMLNISNKEFFSQFSKIYLGIQATQEVSNTILTTIQGDQVISTERYAQLSDQLRALELEQNQVLQTSQEIKSEIIDIKMSSQYETTSTTENQVTVNAVIQNNVTVNQYSNCSRCSQEESKTLPQILNEVAATIPNPKQIAEALNEVAGNLKNHPNSIKVRESVREVTKNVQERLQVIEVKRSENPPIKQIAEAVKNFIENNDAEKREIRRQELIEKVQKFFQTFQK